jgi:lysophospholipase L1-like esterase
MGTGMVGSRSLDALAMGRRLEGDHQGHGAPARYSKRCWSARSWRLALSIALVALTAGGCNLRPTSSTATESSNLKVAVIGDSVAADLAKALQNPSFDGPAGVSWEITAQPGAGWGEGEDVQGNWPLGIVEGDSTANRVRAASERQPSAIVIELGTNDALRASFAYSLNNGTQLLARLVGTDNNIRSDVQLASSLSPCVVLVSPSYYPTMAFGEEEHYSATALQIRTVLMREVSRVPQHAVLLADWAALSSTHRLAASAPENWFTPDGLHPNSLGLKALANLIAQTATNCPG